MKRERETLMWDLSLRKKAEQGEGQKQDRHAVTLRQTGSTKKEMVSGVHCH